MFAGNKELSDYKSKIKKSFFYDSQENFETRLYRVLKEILPSITEIHIIPKKEVRDYDIVIEVSECLLTTLYGKFLGDGKIQLWHRMNENNMLYRYKLYPEIEIYDFQFNSSEIHNPYSYNTIEYHYDSKSYLSTDFISGEFNINMDELFSMLPIAQAQTFFTKLKHNNDFNPKTFLLLCDTFSTLHKHIHKLTFYKITLDNVNDFWTGSYQDSLTFDPHHMYVSSKSGMQAIFNRKGKLIRIEVKKLQINLSLQPDETAPTLNQIITNEKNKLLCEASILIKEFLPYYQILLRKFFFEKK